MPEFNRRKALSRIQRESGRRQPRRFLLKMFDLAVAYFIFCEGYDVKEIQREVIYSVDSFEKKEGFLINI
jgi:hypothetical protein